MATYREATVSGQHIGQLVQAKDNLASQTAAIGQKFQQSAEAGTSVGPDETADMLENKVLPAMQQVGQVLQGIVEGLPRTEEKPMETDMDKEQGQPPMESGMGQGPRMAEDRTNNQPSDNPDMKAMKAKMDELEKENYDMKKSKIAAKYASLFDPSERAAAEKEMMDDEGDITHLESKVKTASEAIARYNGKSGMARGAQLKTAKVQDGPLEWYAR